MVKKVTERFRGLHSRAGVSQTNTPDCVVGRPGGSETGVLWAETTADEEPEIPEQA